MPKIDHNNYKAAFEDFLRDFKEMMTRNYNMFHVQLKDIRKLNPNLGELLAANSRNLSSHITELVQNFIQDLGLGLLKNGLHFNLIGRK